MEKFGGDSKVQRVLFAVVICVMDALSTSSKSSPKSSRMSVPCLDINIIFNSFLLDVTQHLQMYCHLWHVNTWLFRLSHQTWLVVLASPLTALVLPVLQAEQNLQTRSPCSLVSYGLSACAALKMCVYNVNLSQFPLSHTYFIHRGSSGELYFGLQMCSLEMT